MFCNRYMSLLLNTNSQFLKKLRLSTVAKTSLKDAKQVQRVSRKTSKDIENFLLSSDELRQIKHLIPVRILKRNRKSPDDLYLVDSNTAKDIANVIKPYILNRKKTIIETNPGFGFIIKELLKSGLKEAQLYESTVCFREHLLKLDVVYPNRLKLYNRDLFSIWKLSYQDRYDNGDRVKRMLSNVEIKQWHQEPSMTIIGTTATTDFIRHLMLSLIFQFGIMTYGRCELFLVMPPHLYLQLTANPGTSYVVYRASSVLFQLFCDHEILLKVPRKVFLPWDNTVLAKKNSKLKQLQIVDSEYMYLTRIEFKKNLPVPADKLQHLWYFIHHMMLSRKKRVIPSMEKWIPGCGIRLISNNYSSKKSIKGYLHPDLNIYTQSGQLKPEQLLNLFKEFSSWHEYSESPFIASMETALLKMESMHFMDDTSNENEEQEDTKDSTKSKTIKKET